MTVHGQMQHVQFSSDQQHVFTGAGFATEETLEETEAGIAIELRPREVASGAA